MTDWIAIDWADEGSRIWHMRADGAVLAERKGPGALGLTDAAFEPALAGMIGEFLDDEAPTDILIAGTPSLAGRWAQVPARSTPCTPPCASDIAEVPMHDDRMKVQLVTGVHQQHPVGVLLADGLRLSGVLKIETDFDGVVCLPGTRTHWVHVSANEIVSFQSFLTGRIAGATLAAMGVSGEAGKASDDFNEALEDAMARPQGFASRTGSNEAEFRLGMLSESALRDRVYGSLLGLELAAARPYWLGQRVAIVGGSDVAGLYRAAMDAQGLLPEVFDGTEATLNGFRSLRVRS